MEWNIPLVSHNTVLYGLDMNLTLASLKSLYFSGDVETYVRGEYGCKRNYLKPTMCQAL